MIPQVSHGGDGEAQLALDETDLRLPWLEPADEDGDEGLDWPRIGKFAGGVAGFVLLSVLAIWLLRDWQLAPPEGDGSVIAAPDTPYKVRPENPGGKTFAGTGDTSYKVGEGIEREARIAQKKPDPVPVAPPAAKTAEAGAGARAANIGRGGAGRRLFDRGGGAKRVADADPALPAAGRFQPANRRGAGRYRHRVPAAGGDGRCVVRQCAVFRAEGQRHRVSGKALIWG